MPYWDSSIGAVVNQSVNHLALPAQDVGRLDCSIFISQPKGDIAAVLKCRCRRPCPGCEVKCEKVQMLWRIGMKNQHAYNEGKHVELCTVWPNYVEESR